MAVPALAAALTSLPLLWRGIGRYVVRFPKYHLLFGPVSINPEYGQASKELILSYLKNNRSADDLLPLVRAKNPPRSMSLHDADLDEQAYLRVIRSKTAKLFEASARLAPILAGASAEVEELCATYGQALGTAFQVIDDVLDYEGKAEELHSNIS